MFLGFTIVAVVVAALGGVVAVALGLAGRRPSDASLAGAVLTELLLVAQLVIAIVSPAIGNEPTGYLPEYYAYLVSAMLIPPGVVLWALVDRTRWATVVVGVGLLAVAVMLWRMHVIWTVQGV